MHRNGYVECLQSLKTCASESTTELPVELLECAPPRTFLLCYRVELLSLTVLWRLLIANALCEWSTQIGGQRHQP